MSEELKFRSRVVAMLRPLLAFPIENTAAVGTPDVGCVAGFIELKIATRPARFETPVFVNVRDSQRIWMRRWCSLGGRAWFLTKLKDLWLVHGGDWGCSHLGNVSETTLKQSAEWYSNQRVTGCILTQVFCDLGDIQCPPDIKE